MITKVCGMKYLDNASAVAQALPQKNAWMGFIFYLPSPRSVDESTLVSVLESLPQYIQKVGVFVNEENATMLEKAKNYGLDFLQLHGEESPEQVMELTGKIGLIKALPVRDAEDLEKAKAYPMVDYLIFDTKGPKRGGNGIPFDWSVLDAYKSEIPFLLSGGIGPEQAATLQNFHHPKWAGIDLNSRFEIKAGRKDTTKLKRFLDELSELQ